MVATRSDEAVVTGAVVRLWNGSREIVGGGFLVGSDLIATCAHVVADAVGADPYAAAAPTTPVRLDFPLVRDEKDNPARVDAVVERWSPISEDGTGDLALLRLTGVPPSEAGMPPLRRIDRLWDHGFWVLGFPEGFAEGVWSTGLIRGEQSTRWFQLQSTPGEQRIEGGFSGAPVWDAQSGAVVGMTVAAVRGDATTAYLIPIEAVLGLDPELLPCPYRGLHPFDEEHSTAFFGRTEEIDKLVEAVERTPLVAVAGPSGAGKSSLVRAGLLPRMRAAGTEIVDLRAASGIDLGAKLTTPPTTVLTTVPTTRAERTLVVVDQFEELASADPAGARRLLEDLVAFTEAGRVRAVLTVRWSALDQVLTPELVDVLESSTVLIAPMDRRQLREAIVGPAESSPGLAFERGLVDRILDDAGAEPGQLPLVESLLTDLWEHRDGGYLTLAGYEAAGGVAGAVAKHAERVLATVGAGEDTLRRLFTALARPDRDGRFVRRPLPLAQLPPDQRALVTRLAEQRLLVLGGPDGHSRGDPDRHPGSDPDRDHDRDPERGHERGTAELAHQALIDHWPRLRDWLERDRTFLAWRALLDTQREQWEAEGRADSALLRGATLAGATDWLPARETDLSTADLDYLRRSQQRQRWEVRRWRIVTAVLAILALGAGTLAVIAVDRRQVLAGQLATANANVLAREARSRLPTDAAVAGQLALAAWRADPANPQVREALARVYAALRSADAEFAGLADRPLPDIVLGRDIAAVDGADGVVAMTGTSGPTPALRPIPDSARPLPVLGSLSWGRAISPDGRWLADQGPDGAVRVRDLVERTPPRELSNSRVPPGGIMHPRFSADSTRLIWASVARVAKLDVQLRDVRTGEAVPHNLGQRPRNEEFMSFITDDPNLVLVRDGGVDRAASRVVLRSLADGAERAVLPAGTEVVLGGTATAACTPGSEASRYKPVVTVTPVTGGPPRAITTESSSCRIKVSADGGWLVEDSFLSHRSDYLVLRLTSLRDGQFREVIVPPGVGIQADGDLEPLPTLAVVDAGGQPAVILAHGGSLLRLRTTRITPDGVVRRLSDDGRYVGGQGNGGIVIEDPVSGQRLASSGDVGPPGSRPVFAEKTWLFGREPFGWTLTSFEPIGLRRIASYPLPVSANPMPTPTGPLVTGQEVSGFLSPPEDGGQLVTISDGVLAALDPSTGRPAGPRTSLGDTLTEHGWYQRAPIIRERPAHPGQGVLVGTDGDLQVWDARTGKRVGTIPTDFPPYSLPAVKYVVDRTGTRLALLTPTSDVELWDIDSARQVRPAIPMPGAVDVLGFTTDGMLAVRTEVGPTTRINLVDPDRGHPAGAIPTVGIVHDLTTDGTAVTLVGTGGRMPERVELTARAWRDRLCAAADRPFTHAERAILPAGTDTGPPCR